MATSARIDDLRKKFDENPRRYFAPLANEYRKAGDLAQAIAICRQHLADQPGHMSGHIVYGQALFENHEFEEARNVFTAALALDPENLIALRLLGDIARDGGDYTGARGWYQRVLDADPRNEDIQAQLKLVEEAEGRAAAEAAAAPAPVRDTPAVTPVVTPVVADESRRSQADLKTVEMERVPPPWAAAAAAPPAPAEPEPVAPMNLEDVAPPRMSIMGLDLESMANVNTTPDAPLLSSAPVDNGFETSVPFSSSFDGDLENDTNPLAGVSGIETRDEHSAASLTPVTPLEPVAEFKITPPFGADAANDIPGELEMPLRTTPPVMDLGLPPQPKAEPTGLWDTLEDMEGAEAAVPSTAPSGTQGNFEPPPILFGDLPASPPSPPPASAIDSGAFDLIDAPTESAPPAAALEPALPAHAEAAEVAGAFDMVEPTAPAAAGEPFATETMADLYAQQGHHAEALATYRQLLAGRPDDPALTGKIAALELAMSGVPRVRDFFAALARWTPGSNGAVMQGGTAEAPAEAPVAAHADADWMSARAYDLGVFAGASVSAADEGAARGWAAAYPGASDGGAPATAVMVAPPIEAPAPRISTPPTVAAVVDPLPGQPARTASSELSLDQVFTEPAPSRPSRKSASFSFDQFFSQTAQVPAPNRTPTPSAAMPAQPSPEEAEQFQNWLKGLKGS